MMSSAIPTVYATLAAVLLLFGAPAAHAQSNLEELDGSYRLETGEVVTGGYMVEGDGYWMFMDTEHLDKGGLFDRDGDVLRSRFPPDGQIELHFSRGENGHYDQLEWREGGRTLRGERIYPHDSREVHFTSADGTALMGRLLTPSCKGPHPAIVMVHGSGPANRYGGTFNMFFLKRGIAVLAYDKRGYTTDPDAWREPDLAQMSADAAAGVRFVVSQPDIDAARVGLWGSSQGGWVVPPAALDAPATAYMILRAGAVVSEAETNLHENLQEARADGLEGLDLDYAVALRREIYRLAMQGKPIEAADALVRPYLTESWYRAAFGDGPISEIWSDRWWSWARRNLAVASAPAIARFGGPVLWFLGEKDEAVPLIPTRAALERAFASAPGLDHEIVVLKDAPHNFLVQTEHGPRYAEGVFSYMEEWLAVRGFTDPTCWD